MILIPDEAPINYGYLVKSHNEIQNALSIAKARKKSRSPQICFDVFYVVYFQWTNDDDFPSKKLNHKTYETMREIDQEGFTISVYCLAKDLKMLSKVVKNFRSKVSIQISAEADSYPDYIKKMYQPKLLIEEKKSSSSEPESSESEEAASSFEPI